MATQTNNEENKTYEQLLPQITLEKERRESILREIKSSMAYLLTETDKGPWKKFQFFIRALFLNRFIE